MIAKQIKARPSSDIWITTQVSAKPPLIKRTRYQNKYSQIERFLTGERIKRWINIPISMVKN